MTEEVSGVSQAQAAHTTSSGSVQGGPKNNKGIEVFEGQKVKDIQLSGSEAQKLLAANFDTNGDGVYNKEEAAEFNNYVFTLNEEDKVLTIKNTKTNTTTQVTYDNLDQVQKSGAVILKNTARYENGTINYDLKNQKVVFDGGTFKIYHGKYFGLIPNTTSSVVLEKLSEDSGKVDYVIKNSSANDICYTDDVSSITIINTKKVGTFFDRKTGIYHFGHGLGDTQISIDKSSKAEVIQ